MTYHFAFLPLWLALAAIAVIMPPKKSKRPTRANRRARAGRREANSLSLTRFVAPQTMRTRFVYSIRYRETDGVPLAANTCYFQFLGNSIFNPDLNTTFERYPIGVPQWSNLYQRYYVTSSKIDVTVQPLGGLTLGESMFVIYSHAYSSLLPSGALHADDFVGQPNSSNIGYAGPISNVGRLSAKRRSHSMFSRPESQIWCSEDTSGFLVSSSYQPNNQWFWTVVVSGQKDDVTLANQAITFTVTYETVMFQPNAIAVSYHDVVGSFIENTKDTVVCTPGCTEPPPPPGAGFVVEPLVMAEIRASAGALVMEDDEKEVG